MKRSNVPRWAYGAALLAIVLLSSTVAFSQERATVTRVVDHRTIAVGRNEKVVLIGIDKPPTEAFTPRDARDHLNEILRGRDVILIADPLLPDSKGIRARYVYLDGDLVNVRLIAEGYASVLRNQEFGKRETFLQAEKIARRMKIGAWVLDGQASDELFTLSISPNPVSDVAMLVYQIPTRANVSLLVLDSNGRVVASLVNAKLEKGGYSAVFQRLRLPDGRYRVQLAAGTRVTSEEMVLTGRGQTGYFDDYGDDYAEEDEDASAVDEEAQESSTQVKRKNFSLPGTTASKP